MYCTGSSVSSVVTHSFYFPAHLPFFSQSCLKKTLEQILAGFHVLIFSFFLQEEKLIKGK